MHIILYIHAPWPCLSARTGSSWRCALPLPWLLLPLPQAPPPLVPGQIPMVCMPAQCASQLGPAPSLCHAGSPACSLATGLFCLQACREIPWQRPAQPEHRQLPGGLQQARAWSAERAHLACRLKALAGCTTLGVGLHQASCCTLQPADICACAAVKRARLPHFPLPFVDITSPPLRNPEPTDEAPDPSLATDPILLSINARLSAGSLSSSAQTGSTASRAIGSAGLQDVAAWVVPWEALQLRRLIGSGSFGRVSAGGWE